MTRASVANQIAAIRKQKAALEKREAELTSRVQNKVLLKIVEMAKNAGITPDEISAAMGSSKPSKSKKSPTKSLNGSKQATKKVAPKYRNPSNPSQTWTGRGISPKWISDLKAAGNLDSAKI